MDKVYVFGHRKPDTDSVCAAISLAYLKKQQGINAEAYRLGEMNRETEFVLKHFNVDAPKYLEDIKLQIKDIDYHKDISMNYKSSLKKVYKYMEDSAITGVPIVDDNNKFMSLITVKGITKDLIDGDFTSINTNYDNLIETLKGEEILRFDNEINGNIKVVSYKSTTFLESITLTNKDILILGDRHSIIEYAVKSKVKLIIVVGDGNIKDEHLEIAKKNKVNIIKTMYDSYHAARYATLSNYIKELIKDGRIHTFSEEDYYDEFVIKSSKLKHNNYPIIGNNDECLGLLRITDINNINRKKAILVDHNEEEQSVEGLNEAEIIEIVDHHKIGDISTKNPINFRNMMVGSTNTIIYHMYKEQRMDIPDKIRGIMLAAILSDTLCLTSPTTTDVDRDVVEKLATSLDINYKEFAKKMFKEATSLKGRTIEDIVNSDIKPFQVNDDSFAISQVFTLNFDDIYKEKEKYIQELERIKKNKDYNLVLLVVTDILKEGSYLFFTKGSKDIIADSVNMETVDQGIFIKGWISRKKQIVPVIMDNIR